ncbi:hypothetical protein DITRI_Ditri09bG0091800 [Diplodiscus trichospermus]
MGDLQLVSRIRKLNNQNYDTWSMYIESYLQDQDLWEIVNDNDVPPEDAAALKKWHVKVGMAMFAIRTTIKEEMLEHISEAKTPKEV